MIFFLTGPDTYRARQKLSELRQKFQREVDATGLNMVTIDGATLPFTEVRAALTTAPLLARRRFIVIENLLSAGKAIVLKAVREVVAAEDSLNVIVFYEADEPAKKNLLSDWLQAHAHCQAFPPLEGAALTRWVTRSFQERGRGITPAAVRRLVATTGNDLWRVRSESDKLDAYLAPGQPVDERTVDELVAQPFDDNIFPLVDAITLGRLSQAATLLTVHLERGTSPQQLLALLEKQFRVLILLTAHRGPTPPSLSGVHPYVARKLWPVARQAHLPRLKKIYADLAAVDVALKSSIGDPQTTLMSFLVRRIQ